MGKRLTLKLRGKPIPLSRTGHGQFGGKYLAAPSSQQIGLLVDAWERNGAVQFPEDVALTLRAYFFFEHPKSHFGTGKNAGKLKERFRYGRYLSRPDLDNLVKLVCEALQGNAFKDDSRIVSIEAGKGYAPEAGTLIELWESGT